MPRPKGQILLMLHFSHRSVHWLGLVVSIVCSSYCFSGASSCGPAIEGNAFAINCSFTFASTHRAVVIWEKGALPLSQCVPYVNPPVCSPTAASITLTSGTSFHTTYTIDPVTRTSEGVYTCTYRGQIQVACDLRVVAKAHNVSCSQPGIENDSIVVTCTAQQMYPQGVCSFVWWKNGIESAIPGGNIIHEQKESGSYYNLTCTLTIPVLGIGFGSHQFGVHVYPDVTGSQNDKQYGIDSDLTPAVYINPPTIISFTVDNKAVESHVQSDTIVETCCKADGYLNPYIAVQKAGNGTTEDLEAVDGKSELKFNKTFTCTDTGEYICRAHSGKYMVGLKMDVFVKCALTLEDDSLENRVYVGRVKNTLNINIPVIGYPGPHDLQLNSHEHALQSNEYSASYAELKPPYGTVFLKFYSLADENFQEYTLKISNTEGTLVYSFKISGLLHSHTPEQETSGGTSLTTLSPQRDKGVSYENVVDSPSIDDQAQAVHYETIPDDTDTDRSIDTEFLSNQPDDTAPYENTLQTF